MIEIFLALSQHFLPGDWNETHPGIRYEEAPFVALAYHNSEGDISLGAGLVGRIELTDAIDLFGEIGLVTGYEYADVVPMARVGLEIGDRTRLFAAPAATAFGDIGAVVGVEITLGRF